MTPKLYLVLESAPCRSVLLVAKELNLDLDQHIFDHDKEENKTEAYIKLNPQKTVPTLVDGDLALPESHAIVTYLVEKYGKDDSLYPKDLAVRARVNQMLHFDNGVLFTRTLAVAISMMGGNTNPEKEIERVREAYGFIESFLTRDTFIAGPKVTVADFCLLTTVSLIELLVPIDTTKYPKFTEWLNKMKARPSNSVCEEGLKLNKIMIESIKEGQKK